MFRRAEPLKWCGGQVVRRQSAKLIFVGSIPARTFYFFIQAHFFTSAFFVFSILVFIIKNPAFAGFKTSCYDNRDNPHIKNKKVKTPAKQTGTNPNNHAPNACQKLNPYTRESARVR